MAAQLPDFTIPTLLNSFLYWRVLETCRLHFQDSLDCWLLVGFWEWEKTTGGWKVEDREKTFFSCFWWYLWQSRNILLSFQQRWWWPIAGGLPAIEGYSESSRSDFMDSYRLQWVAFSVFRSDRIPKESAVFEQFQWYIRSWALVTPLSFCSSISSNGSSSL